MRLINFILYIALGCVFWSCSFSTPKDAVAIIPKTIDNFIVEKENLRLIPEKGQWFLDDAPFNGYAVSYYENQVLEEKTGFYNGKKEGKSYKYHQYGNLKKEIVYIQNKAHGKSYHYFENGQLAAEYSFKLGKKHGLQKLWYENGELAKLRSLKEGKEEGMQQAWLENGKIYVNYEAKNGRIFGMNRANLCYQLENEKVVYEANK